ncbi:MAG TPA: diguanylate cyclase [Giesbergeria sp.]|nr:diguanylate cyclase [Giesbergeria sp.]
MLSDPELMPALPVAVLITQNGVICRANTASLVLLEADTLLDVQGRLLSDFVHTLDKLRSSDRLQQASAPEHTGQPNKPAEFRVRTAKGHLRMVLVSTVGITLDGAPALLICGMDMTHQNEIQEQLRESERHFRRLFESMQDVYYRTDTQGVVQHVGPGVRRVLGYEPHEIEGHTAESYYPQSKDRDAFKAAIMAHGEVSDFPGQMVRKDGTVIDISISSHALFDHNGAFAGVEGLYRDVTQRKNLERELQRLATTDVLTGMANRRSFLEVAEATFQRARESHAPLTVLMLDLDHFKTINDRFGHLEGDRVLAEFAQATKHQLRASDTVGRLGGEEFGLLLPHTLPAECADIATRILEAIRALELTDSNGQHYGVTTSMGLGTLSPGDRSLHDLLDRADQALYLAKRRGRNQLAVLDAGNDGAMAAPAAAP